MRAAVLTKNGGLDALAVQEVPKPKAGRGEVLLDVRAAALNHLDIWVRKGRPGAEMQFPHILGSDAAGVVADVGEGVEGWSAGDEVVVNPGLNCGHCAWCRRGEHSECPKFTLMGLGAPGLFAEHAVVPAQNLHRKPAHLGWPEAAALTLAHVTAWRMLVTRARVLPGETVLIHGIGGGVAMAALQFVRSFGARAIVTSSSDEKLKQAKEMGAAHGINYKKTEDVGKAVKELTDGIGADAVIDAVGAATWPINFAALRKAGRAVHCGVTSGAQTETNLSALYWNQFSILGSTMGSDEDMRQMLAAVNAAKITPVLDKTFPLAEARAAQQRMEEGEQTGKIVLEVG